MRSQVLKNKKKFKGFKSIAILYFCLLLKLPLLAQVPSTKINQSLSESKTLLSLFSEAKINKLDFLIQIRDKFRILWNFNQEVKAKEQENLKIKQEKRILADENSLLKTKNIQLKTQNDTLSQENNILQQKIKQKESQILVLQSDSIYLEDIVLKAEEVIRKQDKEIQELKKLEDTLRQEMINASFRVEITYDLKKNTQTTIGVSDKATVYLNPSKIRKIRVYFHTGIRTQTKRVPAISIINCQILALNLNTAMNRTSQDVYEANININGKQSVYYPNLKKLKKNGRLEIRIYYIDPLKQQQVEVKKIDFTVK